MKNLYEISYCYVFESIENLLRDCICVKVQKVGIPV